MFDFLWQSLPQSHERVPGTKVVGLGPTSGQAQTAASRKLASAVTQKIKANATQTDQKQVQYDKNTDHGRKQNQ